MFHKSTVGQYLAASQKQVFMVRLRTGVLNWPGKRVPLNDTGDSLHSTRVSFF